jgi:probable F420-dependent oxidoreductase
MAMKVRFGFTCRGQADLALDDFPQLVDDLERLGFDSLWLPELMLNGPFDPLVALAHAAARTERLKLGAYLIVPGRNPARLARELANLDRLSGGRLLLIMVLGQPNAPEMLAQHVTKDERGALLEEVLPLLRRLWSGDVVNHNGPRYQLRDARLSPTPVQEPLEMWLGGQVPGALRRVGRLGDGWIPGLITPTEAAEKRRRVEAAATAAGRSIDPEHFGVNLTYSRGPLPVAAVEQLRRRRPDLDPVDLIPQSRTALHERVDEWLAVGFSKFLLRPAAPPTDWTTELETLAEDILERQT